MIIERRKKKRNCSDGVKVTSENPTN